MAVEQRKRVSTDCRVSRRYRGEPSAVFDDSSESTEDSDEFEEDLLKDAGLSWRERMRGNATKKKVAKKAAPKKKAPNRPQRKAAAAAAAAGAAGAAFARRKAAGESELESG